MHKLIVTCIVILLTLTACGLEPDVDPVSLAADNGAFIEVDGVTLYYETAGDPANPAVILIHGFGASHFSYRLTLPALADAGYYAIAVDRPGFGLSDKPFNFDYSHANQAAQIVHFMDALGIDTATVVGHSQGGNIAAHFALNYPERLDKLVIVAGAVIPNEDGGGGDFGGSTIAGLALGAPELLGDFADNSVIVFLLEIVLGATFDRDMVRELAISAYGDEALVTDEVFEGYYEAFRTPHWERGLIAMTLQTEGNVLTEDELASIEAETLLVWGSADAWVSVTGGETLVELLPNVELVVYDGIGHSPMDTVPEAFNADLLEFIER
ncbi:MAG: alpha/beta hydrolase [Chloroflexi bacterium]|nr:alpha/beta hydrolase [Chloroflexota bacterium]